MRNLFINYSSEWLLGCFNVSPSHCDGMLSLRSPTPHSSCWFFCLRNEWINDRTLIWVQWMKFKFWKTNISNHSIFGFKPTTLLWAAPFLNCHRRRTVPVKVQTPLYKSDLITLSPGVCLPRLYFVFVFLYLWRLHIFNWDEFNRTLKNTFNSLRVNSLWQAASVPRSGTYIRPQFTLWTTARRAN